MLVPFLLHTINILFWPINLEERKERVGRRGEKGVPQGNVSVLGEFYPPLPDSPGDSQCEVWGTLTAFSITTRRLTFLRKPLHIGKNPHAL